MKLIINESWTSKEFHMLISLIFYRIYFILSLTKNHINFHYLFSFFLKSVQFIYTIAYIDFIIEKLSYLFLNSFIKEKNYSYYSSRIFGRNVRMDELVRSATIYN